MFSTDRYRTCISGGDFIQQSLPIVSGIPVTRCFVIIPETQFLNLGFLLIQPNCGWINQDLTLKDREWTCTSCGEKHDRDFNASKNILKQGLKIILSGSGIESDTKQKQVEALSLDESMKPETH